MSLNPWSDRWAPEEANHFNPAYCGVLIYEFVRAYEKARKGAGIIRFGVLRSSNCPSHSNPQTPTGIHYHRAFAVARREPRCPSGVC